MPRFLLSVHTPQTDALTPQPTEADINSLMERITALEERMRAANALISNVRLTDGTHAAVVTAANPTDSAPSVTDGPYLESKELIGGFYVIEAGSRDAAIEWAKDTSRAVGMPIEVRPFLDFRAES